MSLPRYPEYKDSGVEWLGELPSHWSAKPIRSLASLNDEVLAESTPEDHEIEYVDIGSVNLGAGIERTEVMSFGTSPSRARRVVRDGDILVSTVRTYLKAIAPVTSPSPNLIASTGFAVVRPKAGYCSNFLKYALQCELFVQQVIARSTGVSYPAINASDLARIALWAPPFEEQRAIGAFLERETGRIDALIAEQEKLLVLLAEKRQATISHAVTRGLDPNVPMKDSGIAWLGEVPAHWQVRSLKSVVSTPITDGPHETPAFLDEGVAFVSAEAISAGKINFEKVRGYISKEDDARYSQKYRPQLHDIFMVKSGATTGTCAIVDGRVDFNIWSPLAAIRCDQDVVLPYFVLNYLRSKNFQEGVALNWSYGTQQNIGMGVIGDLPVVVPPIAEQHRIVKRLDSHLIGLEALQQAACQALLVLRERRSALISAAVTGQIDVRGIA